MALTAYGRNAALKGVTEKMKQLGLFGFTTASGESSVKQAATSGTAVGASLINMTGAKAKGFTNGKIVMIRKLTASVTGLVAERPYYIVGEVTNGFELALEEGGTGIKVAGVELKTDSEFFLCEEVSVGRIATTFGTPAAGTVSDTAAEKVKVPAGKTVTDAFWHEKASAGTNKEILDVQKLAEPEAYSAEGTYEVTADSLEAPPATA
jgi:hypothetical protein